MALNSRNKADAPDFVNSDAGSVTLPASGSINKRDVREVEPTHDVYGYKAKAEALAFMEEPVTVLVHESPDPNATAIVETWCNGIPQRFIRNVPITVKRKYVEILAQARPVGISTREVLDPMGNRTTKIEKHTGMMYPFSVIEDRNPKGVAWLKGVLSR